MSTKIFIDSDAILDLLAQRQPFYDDVAKIFSLACNKKIEIYATAVILANVVYILRKIKGNDEAKKLLKYLRRLVRVLPVDEKIVDMTLNSKFNDFEDGLQYFAAKSNDIRILITRNVKDYKVKDVTIQTPREFTVAEQF